MKKALSLVVIAALLLMTSMTAFCCGRRHGLSMDLHKPLGEQRL